MPLIRLLVLACALAITVPATAGATVWVGQPASGVLLIKSTTPGEDTEIKVTDFDGWNLIVDITGATYATGSGCSGSAYPDVECHSPTWHQIRYELGPGDDTVVQTVDLPPVEIHGEEGDDVLAGGEGADVIVGGPGMDELAGHAGNDRIDARDGEADGTIHCGGGDDDLVFEAFDPIGTGCEVVAPQVTGTLVVAGAPAAGRPVRADLQNGSVTWYGSAQHPTSVEAIRWYRCDAAGGSCAKVAESVPGLEHDVQPADAGGRLYAEWYAGNRAGSSAIRSALTGIVAAGAGPSPPAPPPSGSAPLLSAPASGPSAAVDLAAQVKRTLGSSATRITAGSLRTLARGRTLPVRFRAPAAGAYRLRLVLPAGRARRYGVRGGRAITLASGGATARAAGAALTIRLTPARSGRRVLRRASLVDLTLVAAVTRKGSAGMLQVTQPVRLRRR